MWLRCHATPQADREKRALWLALYSREISYAERGWSPMTSRMMFCSSSL
jgi:hypothetical protein